MDACVLSQQKVLAPHVQIYTHSKREQNTSRMRMQLRILCLRAQTKQQLCVRAYASSAFTNFAEIVAILLFPVLGKKNARRCGASWMYVCVLLLTFMFHIP
jgi:hypothetical protein